MKATPQDDTKNPKQDDRRNDENSGDKQTKASDPSGISSSGKKDNDNKDIPQQSDEEQAHKTM